MNNKGQSVFSEYVMILFVVIAALVAITGFVQRGLQARIHDARNYMINGVINACDANCTMAAGDAIAYEYEPYYQQELSFVQQNSMDTAGETPGNRQVFGAVYSQAVNESTSAVTTSYQLPSLCAGTGSRPAYCTNFQPPAGDN